jgi:hypothetical protein
LADFSRFQPVKLARIPCDLASILYRKLRVFQKRRNDFDESHGFGASHSLYPAKRFAEPGAHRIDRTAIVCFVQKPAIHLIPLLRCQPLPLVLGHCLDVVLDLFKPIAGKGHRAAAKGSAGRTRQCVERSHRGSSSGFGIHSVPNIFFSSASAAFRRRPRSPSEVMSVA